MQGISVFRHKYFVTTLRIHTIVAQHVEGDGVSSALTYSFLQTTQYCPQTDPKTTKNHPRL